MAMEEVSADYANGQPALRLKDGSGFAYYYSEVGAAPPVAVCVSRVSDYQFSYFFYDLAKGPSTDAAWTRGGAPKAPLLCSIDEHVIGFAHDNTGKHEGIVPGVECAGYRPWPGKINLCKRCGRSSGEHATGTKLVLTKAGAVHTDRRGVATKRWLWDPLKQGAGTPPKEPIAFPLNRYLSFEYKDRTHIRVTFKCESVHRVFECGERLKRSSNYLEKVTGVEIGRLHGKKIVQVDAPTLLQRQAEASKAAAASRTRDNTAAVSDVAVVGALNELTMACTSMSGKTVQPFTSHGWRESALERTLDEVPTFNMAATSVAVKRPSALLSSAGGASLSRTAGAAAGAGAGAASGDTEAKEGYGTMTGVAKSNGKWLGELDVKKTLAGIHPILPRPSQLKDASGRYCIDVPVETRDTVFRKLQRVTARGFDTFITKTAGPDQLVLVACVREDDPACRRVSQVLEHLNGTLAARYPSSPQYVSMDTPEDEVAAGKPCPYWLVKFDMAESRFLVDRYNVQALPTFLAFYSGKLVYAGLMGGSSLIKLPACDRVVNYLVMEPDPSSQITIERALRSTRTPSDLAVGTFDSTKGKVVNVVASGIAHISRLAESAQRRRGAAPTRARTAAGTDTSGDIPSDYSVILASASIPIDDMHTLHKTLQQRAGYGAPAASSTASVPGSAARLSGPSLVVCVLDMGTVLPGHDMCSVCKAVASRGRRKRRPDGAGSPGSTRSAAASRRRGSEGVWACPRCCVVQGATRELLADNACSLAVVKPLKPNTVTVLSRLWSALMAGGVQSDEPAATFSIGLTHDVMLQRLEEFIDSGRKGRYLAPTFRLGVGVAAAETTLRGEPLTASDM